MSHAIFEINLTGCSRCFFLESGHPTPNPVRSGASDEHFDPGVFWTGRCFDPMETFAYMSMFIKYLNKKYTYFNWFSCKNHSPEQIKLTTLNLLTYFLYSAINSFFFLQSSFH